MAAKFKRAVIVGVGQIGASLGMALLARRLAREVVGIGRGRRNLALAKRRRAVSSFRTIRSLKELRTFPFRGDDLVILASPVFAIGEAIRFLPRGSRRAGGPLVIDVGSTKVSIVRAAGRRRLRFIGSHPITGTERGGAAAGNGRLFEKRFCLITPARGTSRRDVARVERLWRAVGARPVRMSPTSHDRLLAACSHLPHAAAYSLVAAVSSLASRKAISSLALSGLKDTTRIAASPPQMWAEIFVDNRKNLLAALGRYQRELTRLARAIRRGDRNRLVRWLGNLQTRRQHF